MAARAIRAGLVWVCVMWLAGGAAIAGSKVVRSDDALSVHLTNGASLEFALAEGHLLGLRAAKADGLILTSDKTLLRPIIAGDAFETDEPWVVHAIKLEEVEAADDGSVALTMSLHATSDEEAIRRVHLWAGDRRRALGDGITPALKAARDKADAARKALNAAADKQEAVIAHRAKMAELKRRIASKDRDDRQKRGLYRKQLRELDAALNPLLQNQFVKLAEGDEIEAIKVEKKPEGRDYSTFRKIE